MTNTENAAPSERIAHPLKRVAALVGKDDSIRWLKAS